MFQYEGMVVENLDVEVLAGTPFIEANDIAVRPAKRADYPRGWFLLHIGLFLMIVLHSKLRVAPWFFALSQLQPLYGPEIISN